MSTRGVGLRSEGPRTPPRMLQVASIVDLGPSLRRVWLAGDLQSFPSAAEASHIKLFFRRPGQAELCLPRLGPSGVVWPPPAARPIARTYSVAAFDASAQRVAVDFVLHGEQGPATRWATHARLGDTLGLAGPGGPNPMLGPASRYLLVGDLTALPAISALVAAMPHDRRATVLIEVPALHERYTLPANPRVRVSWCVRAYGQRSPLPAQVCALALAPEDTFAFVAGENTAVVAIRNHLLGERGFGSHQLYATPYWREQQSEEEYHEQRHRIMDELTKPHNGAPRAVTGQHR